MALIGVGFRRCPDHIVHRIDDFDALLLGFATCSALLTLSWGGTAYAWSSPMGPALSAAAFVSLGILTMNGTRVVEPLLPPPPFRIRSFVSAVLLIARAATSMFAATLFLPLYSHLTQGVTRGSQV